MDTDGLRTSAGKEAGKSHQAGTPHEQSATAQTPPSPPRKPRGFAWNFLFALKIAVLLFGAWTYGTACAIEQIEWGIRGVYDPAERALSWTVFWYTALRHGVYLGAFVLLVGGGWYWLRIRWSGGQKPDPILAGTIYILTAQLHPVLPVFTQVIWDQARHPNPITSFSYLNPDWWTWVVVLLPYFSCLVSFLWVWRAFRTNPAPTFVLFLLLPAALYSCDMRGVTVEKWNRSINTFPNVDYTQSWSGKAMALTYPSNWAVAEEEWEDFRGHVEVEGVRRTVVRLSLLQSRRPLQEELDSLEDDLSEMYEEVQLLDTFDRWGDYRGVGRIYRVRSDGTDWDVRLFLFPVSDDLHFEVRETVLSYIEVFERPGIDLIRSTFRLRVGRDPTGNLIFKDPSE